jgi:predicted HTH transcriptional regulator
MEIFNCNPYYSSVLDICPQSAFDKITVQRHVCALCNQGGGVILIGAQKIDNVLKAVGIKFQSISEI